MTNPEREILPARREGCVVTSSDSKRVLIVEDDPTSRAALAHLLKGEGNRVRAAASGEEGIEACAAERPDLVIMDYRLPDMTGLDALARMMVVCGRWLPAVLVTGHMLGRGARRAADELGVRIFRKPVSPEPFLGFIRTGATVAVEGGGSAAYTH